MLAGEGPLTRQQKQTSLLFSTTCLSAWASSMLICTNTEANFLSSATNNSMYSFFVLSGEEPYGLCSPTRKSREWRELEGEGGFQGGVLQKNWKIMLSHQNSF